MLSTGSGPWEGCGCAMRWIVGTFWCVTEGTAGTGLPGAAEGSRRRRRTWCSSQLCFPLCAISVLGAAFQLQQETIKSVLFLVQEKCCERHARSRLLAHTQGTTSPGHCLQAPTRSPHLHAWRDPPCSELYTCSDRAGHPAGCNALHGTNGGYEHHPCCGIYGCAMWGHAELLVRAPHQGAEQLPAHSPAHTVSAH